MTAFIRAFWHWYERHYALNVAIASTLFLLQIVHLVWLTGEVVWARAFGSSLFEISGVFQWLLWFVDYTEIPALVSVSFLYLNELRKQFSWKSLLYLAFLNSQWLHIFWITDEFVVTSFAAEAGTTLPGWLAWIAILIDYLELPVIVDTLRKLAAALRERRLPELSAALRED